MIVILIIQSNYDIKHSHVFSHWPCGPSWPGRPAWWWRTRPCCWLQTRVWLLPPLCSSPWLEPNCNKKRDACCVYCGFGSSVRVFIYVQNNLRCDSILTFCTVMETFLLSSKYRNGSAGQRRIDFNTNILRECHRGLITHRFYPGNCW